MYNLYQSQLRQDIQMQVYGKPHHTVKLFGKNYFCLEKTKKIGPVVLKRFQVMGVELPNDAELVRKEIARIRKEYRKSRAHIAFQIGLTNEIVEFDNVSHLCGEFAHDLRDMRESIRNFLVDSYDLKLAARENMPQCEIIYDIRKTDEELFAEMNSGAKERIKKGIKKGVEFERLEPQDYETFYRYRQTMAGEKGFNIIPYSRFAKLAKYITDHKAGGLFISRIDEHILAGSVCLFDGKRIIYYQGFANRDQNLRNIGGHAYLKFEIMRWARARGFTIVDMMGGAPTGYPEHPRAGVTKFKESLGGIKIEKFGSFDIVLNNWLYKIFEWYIKSRH